MGFIKPVYFINKDFNIQNIDTKCDIILSPEFYWIKRVTLDVKFLYEVKKLTPSIFDSILPNGNFNYKVYKIRPKEYIVIAYDIDFIFEELARLGINKEKVDKIYTAQSEFSEEVLPLQVGEEYMLDIKDSAVLYIPKDIAGISEANKIEEHIPKKLSKNYIYSKKIDSVKIDKNEINKIILLLLLGIIALGINTVVLGQKRVSITKAKEEILQKYNIPATLFEIKSIKNELLSIDKNQRKLREFITYLGNIKLKKGEFYKDLKITEKSAKIVIVLQDNKSFLSFKKRISKKYQISKSKKNDNSAFSLEVVL